MSWERYDFDEQSTCACGNGVVIKHCYQEDDDWNRYRSGYTGVDILCPNCKSKFHYCSITRQNICPSWKGDCFYTREYLVPKDLNIPSVMTPKTHFGSNYKEEIVCCVTKQELEDVIADMQEHKFSTRVQKTKSKDIIYICKKNLHTQSLGRIIPILQDIFTSYEQYTWNPITIAKYKQQEEDNIKQNEAIIADVISKSYELHFLRKHD